ncbi:MAG TPA: TIGR03936 family radical SAM-associated protein, partial [Anaerolineae bacterium]|nr:TIGR03936 family radical SAM-associated protein [Anaerolineae bacterium]
MEKVILQYGKDGALKYLSHLELMRALERSFRRAKIGIEMSEGFNPRPKISYGPALPVGVSGRSEYLTIDIKDPIPEGELVEKLSCVLPEGLSISRAKYIP